MIRVFKISKSWSSGRSNLVFIWDYEWELKKEDEESYIDDHCYNACSGGHNNGYSFEWVEVTDKEEIKTLLSKELENLENSRNRLNEKIDRFNAVIKN